MGDLIVILKDAFIAIAALTTALVAYSGLSKWKKELKGKVYFDIAREHIRATYKIRDEIEFARSPAIFSNEYPEGYDSFERDNTKKADAYRYIYNNKIERVRTAVQSFDLTTLESEALWGKAIKEKSRKLRNMYFSLSNAMNAEINNIKLGGEYFRDDAEFKK